MSRKRRCRECSCTDDDCSGCIERTGEPCYWVAADLCSACIGRAMDGATFAHAVRSGALRPLVIDERRRRR
jgi:hypothetical protein